MASAGFLPISRVTSLFKAETTSGSLLTHSVNLVIVVCLFHIHLNCILIAKESFSQGSVESFHNRLVSMYLSTPAVNRCFVILHNFSYGVEGTNVITGHKCNKGHKCNNIWSQM